VAPLRSSDTPSCSGRSLRRTSFRLRFPAARLGPSPYPPLPPLTYRIGAADVKWLNAETNTVNTTLGTEVVKANADLAALNVHVTVKVIPVDNGKKSNFDTHRICDTGTPYFHGLEFSGVNPRQWSFHPNDDGIAAYASSITPSL
jgi:hypothetical protein